MRRINLHIPNELGRLLAKNAAKNMRTLTGEIVFRLCVAYGVSPIQRPDRTGKVTKK